MQNKLNTGWLPNSRDEDLHIAKNLKNYAERNTSLTLLPFARSQNIDIESLEGLATLEIEKDLPIAAAFAVAKIKERQDQAGEFLEMAWEDKEGTWYKELHLINKETGKCIVYFEKV